MRTPIFQIDAFTTRRFAGNPAAVMPMESFPVDAIMQSIAAENNLAETAFLVPESGDYRLRWFTPKVEVPLCGHATLASAAVVMERLEPGRSRVVFHSASGPLTVKRAGAGYIMDFPARPSEPVSMPLGLPEALGIMPAEVFANAFNYMALVESPQVLRGLAPYERARPHGSPRCDCDGARGRRLRLHQPLLRPGKGHSGGSCDWRGALHAGALLGQTAGQDRVPRLSSLAAGRGDRLQAGSRSRRTGRQLHLLPARRGGDLRGYSNWDSVIG